MRLTPRWFVLCLFAFALLARGALSLLLRDLGTPPGGQEGSDARDFDLYAWQMVNGHGFTWEDGTPTAFRAPGFSFFLAAIYTVFGHSYPAARIAMWVLGGLSVALTYLLARELVAERVARLAGVLGALYFPHAYLASAFFNENLFAPLLAASLLCFIRGLPSRSTAGMAGSGLLLGLATLVRPFSLLILPLLCLLLLGKDRRTWRKSFVPILVVTLAFLAPCAPWLVRNHLVLGKASLANNGGSTFWGGNNSLVASSPHLWGTWASPGDLPRRAEVLAQPDEVSADRREWQIGMDWVRSHPAQFVLLVAAKVVRLWLPDLASKNAKYTALSILFTSPFLLLMGIGAMTAMRDKEFRNRSWAALHAALIATVIMAAIFWGAARFRDANAPVLMVFAAVGAVRLAMVVRRRGPANPQTERAGTPA